MAGPSTRVYRSYTVAPVRSCAVSRLLSHDTASKVPDAYRKRQKIQSQSLQLDGAQLRPVMDDGIPAA